MRRRHVAVSLATLALAAPQVGDAAARPQASWAQAEIRAVVARGLMAGDVASFRPDEPLTQRDLAELVAGLTGQAAETPPSGAAPVTIASLDAGLVRALGLHDAAAQFGRTARASGLVPSSFFGTEVVARLLGLRKNHAAANDGLERLPRDPATRAEAAYSAAQLLRLSAGSVEAVRAAAATFVLPPLAEPQRLVLATAFRFVGYPYVWGGESELRTGPIGPQAQGGFDCSGFVWRVFKLQPYPQLPGLSGVVRGRTTFTMSAEATPSARVAFAALAPGDLVFFGAKGSRSRPVEIDHVGIYVGGGWIVHSSRHGTTLAPLAGWYRGRFAWGRRPLAGAGAARPAVARP